MRSSHKDAFTLIELLVVISIIGLLSAIVLASLNSARIKGSDSAVQANMNNARAQAELFYDLNQNRYVITAGSATDVCSASGSVGGVRGVYEHIQAAADEAGVPLSTSLTTVSSPSQAVCHACPRTGPCNPKNAWAAEVPLRGGDYFCVDSSGRAEVTNLTLANGDTQCI